MRRALAAVVLAVAVAIFAAGAAVAHRRQQQAELSPWPVVDNPGPRGLAALQAWLAETAREPLAIEDPGDRPPPRSVVVLAMPRAQLAAEDVDRLLGHAERGGTVVWAAGPRGSQPELERRLGVTHVEIGADRLGLPGREVVALAPHPLLGHLVLRSGGGAVASDLPEALPVAGARPERDTPLRAEVLSIGRGRGEILVLAGADLAENYRLAEGDNLALWAGLSARGPVVFDERWRSVRAGPVPASARGLAAIVGQALLAAAALFWASGRRLGAVRPPPPPGASRTAADYLASLGSLYRRARAETQLGRASWRRFRQELARRGIPAALPDDEAARRLEAASPAAAQAFRRGAELVQHPVAGPGELLALTRAFAEAERALRERRS